MFISQRSAHHQTMYVCSFDYFNVEPNGIDPLPADILILTRVLESSRESITGMSIVLPTAAVHTSYEAVLFCRISRANNRGVNVNIGTLVTPALTIIMHSAPATVAGGASSPYS